MAKQKIFGWIITKVFDESDQRCVGVFGPSSTEFTPDELRNHPNGKKFRLLSDDHDLTAEGIYVGPDDERMFSPLDNYGEGNWGCTIIEYWEPGKGGGWKQL